jgi:hypothetical protein
MFSAIFAVAAKTAIQTIVDHDYLQLSFVPK